MNRRIAMVAAAWLAAADPAAAGAGPSIGDIESLHALRTWTPPHRQTEDPLTRGVRADIPTLPARARIIGIDDDMMSLAAKLHLIDNARHTLDLAYYIFDRDTVGYAVLGALCDAVRRGVDVRLVVDSVGSLHPAHGELKTLDTCADDPGATKTGSGQATGRRARVQVVLFNAISNISGRVRALARNVANLFREPDKPRISIRINRRSHDKLLVADGRFPGRAAIVIGGRNMSNDYFGLGEDGSPDPDTYRDVELFLRTPPAGMQGDTDVGEIAADYFQALFLHTGNKRIEARTLSRELGLYRRHLERFGEARSTIRSLESFRAADARIASQLREPLRSVRVRLAHELANLTNRAAVTRAHANMLENPNSIINLLRNIGDDREIEHIRVVSPYLFFDRYPPRDDNPVVDEARALRQWIESDRQRRLEIITGSVLTTDNALAQAIIDMQMAPLLLLPEELRTRWQESLWDGRVDDELVNSEAWREAVDNPRIRFLQTGRVDSHHVRESGVHYGLLHAKFITADDRGFVGTANFDYRSRFLNNEAGYFYENGKLSQDLGGEFDKLARTSYRWGSPEWLEMRRALIERGGPRAATTRWQRAIYGFLHGFYLSWLI